MKTALVMTFWQHGMLHFSVRNYATYERIFSMMCNARDEKSISQIRKQIDSDLEELGYIQVYETFESEWI